MEANLRQKNILNTYILLALLAFLYVVWRSFSVGFTHDECLSFNTASGDEAQMFTANNHWLNTILMFLSSKIFGSSEFALRLPNVISFGFYLYFVWKIFSVCCTNPWSLLLAAPLFLLNPFMLDFFGLARGYGLAMTFFTAAIYHFLVYFQQKQSIRNLIGLVICSVCCVYSNYSFLTAILAIHGTALTYHFKIHREKFGQLLRYYAIEAILLIPAALNILYLGEKNELYVGGDNNVLRDTVRTILDFSFSFEKDEYKVLTVAIILLINASILSLFIVRSKSLNFIKILIVCLLLIPTVLHYSIDMLYPKDRAALYWMIVIGFLVMFAIEAILNDAKNGSRKNEFQTKSFIIAFSALSFLQIFNFILNFNTTHTIIWKYDADVKNALQAIEAKNGAKPISIGASWLVEPELNYYRKKRDLNWIQPVAKDGVTAKHDFYLVFEEDMSALKDRQMEILRYYKNSEMYLMKEK